MFRRYHVSSRQLVRATLYERLTRATLESTRSQVHITSSSSTHLNPQQQCKPANTVQAIRTQSHRTRRDPSEKQTSSHSHALDNTLPHSRGRLGDFPLPGDQPRSILLHPSSIQKYDINLVSVLVSQPVLLCVVVLWYVTVFMSSGLWVRFWRGWQVVASVYWTSPLLNYYYYYY